MKRCGETISREIWILYWAGHSWKTISEIVGFTIATCRRKIAEREAELCDWPYREPEKD